MSITQVSPTTAPLQAPTAQRPSAPTASPADLSTAKTPSAPPRTSFSKADADGDFDGSKTANEDSVKVSLSAAALKELAAKKQG